MESPVLKAEQAAFDAEITQRLGPAGKTIDFSDDQEVTTPEYPLYEDEDDGVVKTIPEEDDRGETTSEIGDTYIGAEVVLSQEDTQVWYPCAKDSRRSQDDR